MTDRTMLIDAIIANPFHGGPAQVLTDHDYMSFTGNQWNEGWEWNKAKLEEQSIERLERIYAATKRGWLIMSDIRD